MHEITATEAARNFSEVLDQVDRERRAFLIRRGGKVVAAIVPPGPRSMTVGELLDLLRTAPKPDEDFADDIDRFRRELPLLTDDDPWQR
jgi:antitoxin (DNA-binding transcriptional repressor) of toxin-antitoxin stability system